MCRAAPQSQLQQQRAFHGHATVEEEQLQRLLPDVTWVDVCEESTIMERSRHSLAESNWSRQDDTLLEKGGNEKNISILFFDILNLIERSK